MPIPSFQPGCRQASSLSPCLVALGNCLAHALRAAYGGGLLATGLACLLGLKAHAGTGRPPAPTPAALQRNYPPVPPSFQTPAGTITGWYDAGVLRATGIPYAHAERFQRPEPVPPAPIRATAWALACPQVPLPGLGGVDPRLTESEQCQQLSITLPLDVAPTEQLPVMVWIHGGAYTIGAGDAALYDPQLLVKEQRVIVVAITYRLGLFGFLGGYADRPANLGLLDMLAGLRWVHANIASLGGDPANVTLFGQSAGGDAVARLLLAEGSQGLFRRAIIQSAPFGLQLGRQRLTQQMGRVAARLPAKATTAQVLAYQDTVAKVGKHYGFKGYLPYAPQYGYAPLPPEAELVQAGRQRAPEVEVLVGSTDAETSLFFPAAIGRGLAKVPLLGKPLKNLLVHLTTQQLFGRGARQFARRHAQGGGTAYLYRLHWHSPTTGLGATHAVELPLLFGTEKTWPAYPLTTGIPTAQIQRDGQQLRALWAQFARTGHLDAQSPVSPKILTYKRL